MKDESFYVGIENPVTVRTSMLEASKVLIQLLQKYESIRTIRAEKEAQASKLKVIYDDMVSMVSTLKSELPDIDLKSLPAAGPVIKHHIDIKQGKSQEHAVKRESVSNVDRLEAELNEIEQKLKGLNN